MKKVKIEVSKNFSARLELIKEVHAITGLSLRDSKILVDTQSFTLDNIQDEDCKRLKYNFPQIKITESSSSFDKAKQAVYYNSDCVLLSKGEYQELCKYKGLYLDLKGEITKIAEAWK